LRSGKVSRANIDKPFLVKEVQEPISRKNQQKIFEKTDGKSRVPGGQRYVESRSKGGRRETLLTKKRNLEDK